jgi:prolyl-tRNA editing enzyme YbaK/EbsC (Cys-tRNA(Pro) deacylase)
MAIPAKITKYLDDNKYKYQVVEHKTVFTAWDKAQTEKVKPVEVAKTLVVTADKDHILAVVPSNKKLDKVKLLKIINAQRKKEKLKNYKKLDLAKELWMKKSLPGKVGATPPFSGLIKLPVYIDGILTKNKKIYVGSGEYTASFRINTGQYLKIEKPMKGNFGVKK